MGIGFIILRLYINSLRRTRDIMTLPADIILKQLVKVWHKPTGIALPVWSMTLKTPSNWFPVKSGSADGVCTVVIYSLTKICISFVGMTWPCPSCVEAKLVIIWPIEHIFISSGDGRAIIAGMLIVAMHAITHRLPADPENTVIRVTVLGDLISLVVALLAGGQHPGSIGANQA